MRTGRRSAASRSSSPRSREAGAGPEHVVRTRIYVTTPGLAEVARAHGEVFGERRPASTMLVIARLLDPRWKVEIEAEAGAAVKQILIPTSITGKGSSAGGSVLDHKFGKGDPYTLGVEEEYMLLDAETFDLVQHIDTVLAAVRQRARGADQLRADAVGARDRNAGLPYRRPTCGRSC